MWRGDLHRRPPIGSRRIAASLENREAVTAFVRQFPDAKKMQTMHDYKGGQIARSGIHSTTPDEF
jgi:hypothetical protein